MLTTPTNHSKDTFLNHNDIPGLGVYDMRRVPRFAIYLLVIMILVINIPNIEADKIEKKDVKIDPYDHVGDSLWAADKGDEIEIKVNSDLPINVYILTCDDYLEFFGPNVSKAKYSVEKVTSTKFTFKIPDDQSYYLVIINSNTSTATVDYEYTDILSEDIGDIMFGFVCIILLIVGIIIIVVIIVYFATRKKRQQPPVYPQQPYQPQYPLPPPPPPPQPPPTK